MRTLIQSRLATTLALAALGLTGCMSSGRATAPKPGSTSFQTPARPTDNMNAGDGYNGGASENVNRGTTPLPTSVGGGPKASESDATGGSMGTSGTDSTGTDMTGDVTTPDTAKKKSAPSPAPDTKTK